MTTTTIAAAVSGGVDSMMAAHLLQQQGHEVLGLHFVTGYEAPGADWRAAAAGEHPVFGIGEQLGIKVEVVDCRREFQEQVVAYFTGSYQRGQTPNPCVVCNPRIKFGLLLAHAERRGAAALATGHYARIDTLPGGSLRLRRGVDPQKDQSYFLARLTQAQLGRARFPLGEMTKAQVKDLARRRGLAPTAPAESQDVCFIKTADYAAFLEAQPGFRAVEGPIQEVGGKVIGRHRGLHRFTVGQRRGINCPAAEPYYVVAIEPEQARLVVGTRKDVLAGGCQVADVNWIPAPPPLPCRAQVRVRYRSREKPATLSDAGGGAVAVEFDEPQAAVTPGQAAVFYDGERVLGGGFIVRPLPCRPDDAANR